MTKEASPKKSVPLNYSEPLRDKGSKGKELTLQDKVDQSSVQARIREFIKNKKVNPWVVELDPTTACNLACQNRGNSSGNPHPVLASKPF